MLQASSIRTFIPGGKDYSLSKAFYLALGFELVFDAGEVACFRCSAGEFMLQNYHHEGWAHNFMMQLFVDDLDAWWDEIVALDLPGRFGVSEPKAPALQPWGLRIAYVVGPSGELWHMAETPGDA